MTSIIYNWRDNVAVKGKIDASVAGEELQRIETEYGYCTPELLVDESRPRSAPLHPAFTWNDREAAELYRRHQARTIIRGVHVEYPDSEAPEPLLTRVMVTVPCEDRGGHQTMSQYRITRDVVRDPDLLAQALESARSHAAAAVGSMERLERIARKQNHPGAPVYRKAQQQMRKLIGALR